MILGKNLPLVFRRWLVVLVSGLLFFYSFLQLNMLNAVGATLMDKFSLSGIELGHVSSMYFYANCILLLPVGFLLDRFSARRLILFATIIAVLGEFGFALSMNPFFLAANRFLMGIGGAFCFVSSVRLATHWFPANKLALVIGILFMMSNVGGLLAQTPIVFLLSHFGWRAALLSVGYLGLFILALMYFFIEDYPTTNDSSMTPPQSTQHVQKNFWQSLQLVVREKHNWLGGIYTSGMTSVIFILGALWGDIYLVQMHHITAIEASYVITLLFIGASIGAPVLGGVTDLGYSRRNVMMLSAFMAFVFMVIIAYFIRQNFWMLMILFLMLGFFAGAQCLSYSMVAETNALEVTGTASSFVSLFLIASGAVFQILFGFLVGFMGKPVFVDNVSVYSEASLKFAITMIPIIFLITIFSAFLTKK